MTSRSRLLLPPLLTSLLLHAAVADDVVTLHNGDVITGQVVHISHDRIIDIKHPGGRSRIPLASLSHRTQTNLFLPLLTERVSAETRHVQSVHDEDSRTSVVDAYALGYALGSGYSRGVKRKEGVAAEPDPLVPVLSLWVKDEYAESIALLKKLADDGHATASYVLAIIYRDGAGVPADATQFRAFLSDAAAKGNADAQYELALIKLNEGRRREGWRLLRSAVDGGHTDAVYIAGSSVLHGYMGLKKNPAAGVALLTRAAEHGHTLARYELAVYQYDYGDRQRGLQHLKEVARDGFPEATYKLATHFFNAQDVGEAAKWAQEAAEAGDHFSQLLLAEFYASGTGVPADLMKAEMWAIVARATPIERSIAYFSADALPTREVCIEAFLAAEERNLTQHGGGRLGKEGSEQHESDQ